MKLRKADSFEMAQQTRCHHASALCDTPVVGQQFGEEDDAPEGSRMTEWKPDEKSKRAVRIYVQYGTRGDRLLWS